MESRRQRQPFRLPSIPAASRRVRAPYRTSSGRRVRQAGWQRGVLRPRVGRRAFSFFDLARSDRYQGGKHHAGHQPSAHQSRPRAREHQEEVPGRKAPAGRRGHRAGQGKPRRDSARRLSALAAQQDQQVHRRHDGQGPARGGRGRQAAGQGHAGRAGRAGEEGGRIRRADPRADAGHPADHRRFRADRQGRQRERRERALRRAGRAGLRDPLSRGHHGALRRHRPRRRPPHQRQRLLLPQGRHRAAALVDPLLRARLHDRPRFHLLHPAVHDPLERRQRRHVVCRDGEHDVQDRGRGPLPHRHLRALHDRQVHRHDPRRERTCRRR